MGQEDGGGSGKHNVDPFLSTAERIVSEWLQPWCLMPPDGPGKRSNWPENERSAGPWTRPAAERHRDDHSMHTYGPSTVEVGWAEWKWMQGRDDHGRTLLL